MKREKMANIGGLVSGSLLLALVAGCDSGKPTAETPVSTVSSTASSAVVIAQAEVANSTDFARDREPVYFNLYDLGLDAKDAQVQHLIAKEGEQRLPAQLVDRDADGVPDDLLVTLNFAPAQKRNITILADANAQSLEIPKQAQAEISHKVGGEWQDKKYIGGTFQNVKELTPPPQYTDHSEFIRYEGPGIESDKVAYRIYLDWRNGFDIFGKKTTDMVLQNVGQDGYQSYHEPADWGMDLLKVGKSLGAGGYGFWNGKEVELVSKVDQWTAKVVEDGPLYSALNITYKGWEINDKKLDLVSNLSMSAGSRLVHTRLSISEELPNLAIGMVKHPGTKLLQGSQEISGYAWTYVASWGKQSLSGEDDYLGMAILFHRQSRIEQTEDANSYVSVMEPTGGELEYYFLAAWDGEENGIKTEEEFVAYLEQEVTRLTTTPRIRLENRLSEEAKSFPITADAALNWSKRLVDSELERKTLNYHYDGWDEHRRRKPKFEYDIHGVQISAVGELAKVAPDARYDDVAEKVTGSFVTDEGDIREYDIKNYNIDSVAPGTVVLDLYEKTKDEKYRKAADLLRKQLKEHPRTSEGAFWHKQAYPHQVWLDGVYMGMPFLARYSVMFEDGASLAEVVKEFKLVHEKLRNPESGLYYHAWDESKQMNWADKETGLSEFYWGRGLGWLTMALVDVLDYIPENNTELRKPLLDMITELAADLRRYQDPATGTWYQIMDQPERVGNYRESSGSAMFTYFYAKAINKGYIPDSYRATAEKAYEGLIKEFITVHSDGLISMTNQCLVAGLGFGRDGSYDYYMSERVYKNDPKGNGPFILAGVEMYKLLGSNAAQ
ncbi:MAG: glycoside hydrolase family 88 protein [Cellvibrio sp.]